MCHTTDSRPPAAPHPGTVARQEVIELTSADGTAFTGFHATPAEPRGHSIVVLPDVRGVHPYYRDLARRFAEAGFATVAFDYYGRTAGLGLRDDGFDWDPHFQRLVPEQVERDGVAAIEYIRGRHPGNAVFTVGFCLGGGHSWRLSGAGAGIDGCVGFYGLPGLATDRVNDFSAPLLMLLAGNDVATSPQDFAAFRHRLDDAGKAYEHRVYDGAPHSFFDRAAPEWADACDDAWRRLLEFTERHGAKASA
ncbi:MAG TPA: dienelactone hydrolase family protein [Stackebrandtia sp.]|jgi:carboxymethylenebutenolidase|uniref:dienelactone hydrolase family protein n=1 Tax=Stackebrandtia sp. TaxID=2023065 RepID=UPI002D69B8A0|nr:dienelactone hydrolase family protein [Stackebrandtia sp.]HZE40924.1 dienelactone hydrolase family protein [Stackebrandtia sp.]